MASCIYTVNLVTDQYEYQCQRVSSTIWVLHNVGAVSADGTETSRKRGWYRLSMYILMITQRM